MSEKHLVCQGAACKCQFGTAPDKLKVNTQSKHYINDKDSSKKLVATDKDIGQTFEKNTFGNCSMLNNSACTVNVTQWQGFYDNVTLKENKGHPLLDDSKAICAIGGSPCISLTDHGQTAEIGAQQAARTDAGAQMVLNPLLSLSQVAEGDDLLSPDYQKI